MVNISEEMRQAIAYLERGAYGYAEVWLKKAIEKHPDNAYLHTELVWCFGHRSADFTKWRACNDYYQTVYRGTNSPAIAHFVAGEQLRLDELYLEAERKYRKAQEAGLRHPAVDLGLARVHRAMANQKEARISYEAAGRHQPFFVPALHEYAAWEFSEGNFRNLRAVVEKTETAIDKSEFEPTCNAGEQMADLQKFRLVVRALEDAVLRLNEGGHREALSEFWPLFRTYKMNCPLIRNMILMFVRADWLVTGALRMAEAFPDEGVYDLYARGQVAWHSKKEEDALTAFNHAIDRCLVHPLVFCARAQALAMQGDGEGAKRDLLRAYDWNPHLTVPRLSLAMRALDMNDHMSVLEYAELTTEETEDACRYDVNGHEDVARLESLALKALLRLGNKRTLLARARETRIWKAHGNLCFMTGIAFAANGLDEDGLDKLSEAINADAAVVLLAGADERLVVTQLAERFPENYELALASALFLEYDDDMESALTALTELAERFAHKAGVYFHLGRVAWILNRHETAEAALRRAVALHPSDNDAQTALCGFLLEQSRAEDLLQIMTAFPNSKPVLSYALEAARELQDTKQERVIAASLAKLYPGNLGALASLLRSSEDDARSEIAYIRRFCDERPLDFESAQFLFCRLLSHGQVDEARAIIERSLSLGDRTFTTILCSGLVSLYS